MPPIRWLSQALSWQHSYWLLLGASLLYIVPFLMADQTYADDYWRSQLAQGRWTEQGRPGVDLLYMVLGFSSGAINLFPLPLLLTTGLLAVSLTRLAHHYFSRPTALNCLIVLPVLYNPFFLQNLSYQYDGPGMVLSLCLAVEALLHSTYKPLKSSWKAALWMAAALALYQPALNVLVGLYCIEFIRSVEARKTFNALFSSLLSQLIILAMGLLIYACLAIPFIKGSRTHLLNINQGALQELDDRIQFLAQQIALLVHGELLEMTATIITLVATVKLISIATALLQYAEPLWRRVGVFFIFLVTAPLLIFLVSGTTLMLKDFIPEARTLTGFSILIVAALYLYERSCPPETLLPRLFIVLPLAGMLSLSFVYGNVLSAQKELGQHVARSIAYDIDALSQSRTLERIHLRGFYLQNWLPAAQSASNVLPVLGYLLNTHYLTLPEALPRTGIINVHKYTEPPVGEHLQPPVLIRPLYRVHLSENTGYLVLKKITEPQDYHPEH
ncbi:glucosyltransferase domain-containing protein [Pseudomonas amygdali]|uniref:glucosyltransferase domain-containing protein n=2 Tax=Pseudomonas syringae group TaxID=136849 RepID=UPI001C5745BA|nr:glucosyltransferase domain-containing protein [Pseudomonas amygdali]QXW46656.1 glucosyltransferase domain-containing protein [Pseudomonas amygdali]